MRASSLITALILASLGLSACGGGGGPVTPPAGDPPGTGGYWFFTLAGFEDATTQEVRSSQGLVTQAANGAISGSVLQNTDGSIATDFPINGFSWQRLADGVLHWENEAAPGGPLLSGGMAADERVGLLGAAAAIDPTVGILLRKQGTFSNASLSGAYHGTHWIHLAPTHNESALFSLVFDGQGAYTPGSADIFNADGMVGAVSVSGGTYSVASDGETELNGSSRGAILEGGDLLVLGGGTNNADSPISQIYIRQATAATNATVAGDYWIVVFQHINGVPEYTSFAGSMNVNATGTWSATGTANTNQTVVMGSNSGAYTVSANGVIQFGTGGNDTWRGAISPDGAYGFLGGGVVANDNPTLIFFVRK